MKIKFNQFEKVAGLFVLGAIGLFLMSMLGVAMKQGWFDSKVTYMTKFKAAEGLHAGATVQIAGLRAGSVDEVELTEDNMILVHFSILEKFTNRIKVDSQAQLIRPFIIGERALEVTVGSTEAARLDPKTVLRGHDTMDLMTVLSGRNLGESLAHMGEMMDSLKTLARAFLDKDRTQSMIQMFDRVDPLLKNLNTMSTEVIKLSRQATKDDNLGRVMAELSVTTRELNALIPLINQKAPKMGQDIEHLVGNLAVLTEQFKVFIPALAEIGPDLPHASRRAVQALDEAVVLLKAMQKSFLIRGSVEDVREEEERARRLPASK
ncbi:MAG: MlaD family protein [Bdellovibrio sp.]|jgi:phospholipid/cholesterol/gamma-HCH transport system substrate-binding protein